MAQEPGSYSGEPGNNIFEEIQKSGSTSNPSSQFLTQERALAAISPQTGSIPTGNVSVGGNTFPARTSPYIETAGSQGFQEFTGTAGNAAVKLAAVLPAFTAVGAPVTAAASGLLGPGMAASTLGFGAGGVMATGVGMGYDYLTGPGGITGQQAYQRMDESGASLAGEIAPLFTAMVPYGAGSWNLSNIGAAGIAGGINAVAREGIYNPTASRDETLKNIGLETAMGAGFGAMRPTTIGQALAQPGINAGLNNPLYRGAVRNMIFDGATSPTINNGAINGVPLQQPGGTATAYDPVSGTGRVLFRNPDGTVSTANYTNLEGQAAKLSGAHTAGMPYAGTQAPDFYASVYGRPNVGPNPRKEGPIDVEATQAGPTARLKAPEWGETGDVGKPDGRGPVFGQDPQAPGPKDAQKPSVEPAATQPTTPNVRPSVSTERAPAAPKQVRYGIPENPSDEWWKEPGNKEKWDKFYRDYQAWKQQYGRTHFLDGSPMPPEYVEGTPEYAAREARQRAQREAAEQQRPPATETPAPATPTATTETTAPTATTEPAAPAPTTTAPTVTAETPATAVAGVETPTAPKPTVATAERPPVWTPPEVAGTGPKPAVIGQTETSGNDVATTGSPVGEPASGGAGGGASAAGKPPVSVAETLVSIPGDTAAPVIPDRKKDATREEILSGTRGMDEASPGVEASFTNDERKKYFDNRAKHLLTSDPSKLTEKDIRERASIVGSAKPSVPSTNATYTGPKLPAFVTSGLTAGKSIDEVFKDIPETQKAEFTSWLRDFKIWMDSISHDNKTASEIATTSTPESLASQNHTIADAGYSPKENQITTDIKAGGRVVAISDYNNATYDKAQLNHDENTYIRHPQTKKVVSIQMPNGDVNHYEVSGPLFVNGLLRDAGGNIVSDDPVGIHEANISGKPAPVGTPTVLQFTPNAAKSVTPIESTRLLPKHTNKIPAAQTAAPIATPVAPAPVAPAPTPTAVSEPAQEQPSARFEDTFVRRGGKYPGPDNYFYAKDKSALVVRNTDGSLTLYKGIQPDGNNRLWTYKNEKELMDGYKGMLDKAEKASEPTKTKPVATEQPAPAAVEQPPVEQAPAENETPPASTPKIESAIELVIEQVEKVVDVSGLKNGKQVFEKVLQTAEELLLDSQERAGFNDITINKDGHIYADNEYIGQLDGMMVSFGGKFVKFDPISLSDNGKYFRGSLTPSELKELARMKVSKVLAYGPFRDGRPRQMADYTVKIPGDGTFKLESNPVAISRFIKRLKQEGGSIWKTVPGYKPVYGREEVTPPWQQTEVSQTPSEKEMDKRVEAAEKAEAQAVPPNESTEDAWKEANENKESQAPIQATPSSDAIPKAAKDGKRYKNFSSSVSVKDGQIKFGGRGTITTTINDFEEMWQSLLKSYASDEAAPLRSGAFPAFFDNSDAGGAGSWITSAIPMTNGNFLIYEVNPYGKKPEGNARNRMVRLFRYVVNSSGVQLLQPFEISKNELVGFKSKDEKYAIPPLLHAMIAAADDYTRSKSLSVDEVLEVSGGRAPLTGIIDSQLKDYEENSIAPVGIRSRMEEFNALPHGLSVNNAVIVFMSDPSNNENAKVLAYELEFNANLSKEQARKFVRDIIQAQGGDQSLINFNVVREPFDDTDWPGTERGDTLEGATNKRGAAIFLEWLKRGRKALVTEVGTDDPATGLPMPKEIPKPGLNPQGKPWTKIKKLPNGDTERDANGDPVTEPWMVPNPKRWLIEYPDFVNEETFHVRDEKGNTTFKPMPYQIRGMNAALGRFLIGSSPVKTGEVARAFLNMDAPGLGKTIQILGTAKMWHEKMKVWTKDPNSPWFGKPAKVLVVSQNRTILKNAFGGDAAKMGLDLGGQFVTTGGHTKFVPKKTVGTDEGGLSIDGEESWIDFATYSDIKPQGEKVPIWLDDAKTKPKMVPLYVERDGEVVIGADGQPMIEQEPDGKGGTKDKYIQDFEVVPNGPPKKGAGEWGLVIFDECHNMKNMDSGRSQAGHDLFIRSQHVMLATGTPIDKPHLLGYFIAMVLDMSLHDIAPELQMKVEGSKISKRRKSKGFTAQDFRDSLSIKHWGKLSPDKQQEVFMMALQGIRRIRDRAGNLGRLIRRGKAFFGIPDLWFDCTDSMTPEAKELIIRHEIWWAAHIATLPPAARRNAIGQKLMESKRLAACIKLGVPETRFNNSSEPKGALRFLLNEIKNGRKVIITIDTTNEDGEIDPTLKGRLKGLPGPNGLPSTYDSEFVMLRKYLEANGIDYGTIIGADIKDREHSIAEFQKNNMNVPVIIMTIASGGTGISLQDLFNQVREWGYDRKTGLPKIVPGEEYEAPSDKQKFVSGTGREGITPPLKTFQTGGRVRSELNKLASSEDAYLTYDTPFPTDSHARSMIIVSAPWGGDAVEQVIGRADRMNTTTPTRVFWMTTAIASGDKRLIELVRAKIATLEAMIKYGDDLDALIAGGIEAEGVKPTAPAQLGQSKKLPVEAAKTLAKSALQGVLAGEEVIKETNESKIEGILASDPELNIPSNKRKVQRWRSAVKKAKATIDSIKVALTELENGTLDPYSVDPSKIKIWLQARGAKTSDTENPDEAEVDPSDDEDDESMDNVYRNIVNQNIVSNKSGVAMIVPPGGTKASRNKLTNIISNLYGLQSGIVPEMAKPELTEQVQKVINDIVRPYRAAFANGEINQRRFAAILGFATDVAWRLTDYEIGALFVSDYETGKKLSEKKAAGAINTYAKELMTLIYSEPISKQLFGKPRMTAKDSMYTTFHEVGHALMAMIPDDIKGHMQKELEVARESWFASLPDGDVRKSLSMPEHDWHYTGGLRNYTFREGQTTNLPLGNWSKREKTYKAPSVSRNQYVTEFHRYNGAPFLVSPFVALALNAFAESGGRVSQENRREIRSIFEITQSGIGREGQLGFKPGAGAIAPFMALFHMGLGVNMFDKDNPSNAPIIEHWREGQDGSMQLVNNGPASLNMMDIQNLVVDGKGYITTDPKNSRFAIIRAISPNGKISNITIDAQSMIESFLPKFVKRHKGTEDTKKLASLGAGSVLSEFIYGATDDDFMRQVVSGAKKQDQVYESRIYRLMNLDEWLAENTAAYCRDYYMLGNYSSEVSMAGDIVASLFVHASSGGDSRITRRIISGIIGNTIPMPKDATSSGTEFYMKYKGDSDAAIRSGSQQSGSLSPPSNEGDEDVNVLKNIFPKGVNVTEDPILKTGRAAVFTAAAVRTVKQWALTAIDLKEWAVDTAYNLVPSSKNLAKLQKDISKRRSAAKALLKAPLTYGAEGLVGTLIGQIEQIGRITNNDMVRELGKRLYTRPDTGEFNRDTFTEDMIVWRNYWQAIFNRIVEKHLSEKIKNSSEARDRFIAANKGFDISNGKATIKKELANALANYVLNVVHPDYNSMVLAYNEATAYIREDKWDSVPQSLKTYLQSIGITTSAQVQKLKGMINQTEIDVAGETAKYGSGGRYDKISFGREADAYLSDFFEDGTIDKLLMDVGRCMAVSRNTPNYNDYLTSKFSPDVIACAMELIEKWAGPYREWSKSMGKEIDDWGTSWRPRVIDSDAVHGIRGGVRNRSDSFILKAAKTIYKDNKHQRVLLPRKFKQFFEDNSYFIQLGVDFKQPKPSKSLHGITQAFFEAEEWRQQFEKGKLPKFLMERVAELLRIGRDTDITNIDYQEEFGFDVTNQTQIIKPKHANPTEKNPEAPVETTPAVSIAIALKTYRRFLDVMFDSQAGAAVDYEKEMVDKAIERLDEQNARKKIEQNLTMIDAFKLARKFSDRVLHKSLGLASSGNGYSDIFGAQFGNLNNADSMHQRLMECEFADEILSEFYVNDVRIFGKHYNDSVTKTILIRHHIPESFWNALQRSVVSDPNSTHFWPDICWCVRRITESDQEEGSSGLITSMMTLGAHSLYMTGTAALQFAEPLAHGVVMKREGPIKSAVMSSKSGLGNLGITLRSLANTLYSATTQLVTAGNVNPESAPLLGNSTKEDQFFRRLAIRVGVVQNKYLEGLDTSTADSRGILQRMSDMALERFHYSGSGLTAVTDASRVAVLKGTIMALEQMADEIITKTMARNHNGLWVRGEEFAVITQNEKMFFRNIGVKEADLSYFLEFCVKYRASITGDYSAMSPDMMEDLIESTTRITKETEKERWERGRNVTFHSRRNPMDIIKRDAARRAYFNALARINFATVQVSTRATEQRVRAALSKVTSAGTARFIFFLTHYGSSFGRNIVLPASRVFKSSIMGRRRQFNKMAIGEHDPAMRLGNIEEGTYVDMVKNPYSGFKNSARALATLTSVFALMIAANYVSRKARATVRKNPAISIVDKPTTSMEIVQSIDSSGFLSNISLPFNLVLNGIRYNRSASQVVAGPYPGKIFQSADDIRNAYSPNSRNSPNTPTAERKVAGDIYDIVFVPVATEFFSYVLPRTNMGDMLNFAAIQAMAHPGTKEAFKRAWPGSGEAVPRRKSELDAMYNEGKITFSVYMQALKQRRDWEAANPTKTDAIGERERR